MTIKEARQFAGMTIKEVADLTGIPYRSLQNWDNGLRQPPEYVEEYLIQKLCQERQVARVKISDSVVIETLNEEGSYDVAYSVPVQNGLIPVGAMIQLGRLSEAGFKIIYI